MVKHILVTIFIFIYKAEAFCNWPCTSQERQLYTQVLGPDPGGVAKFSCRNPTILQVLNSGDTVHCIERSGPFVLTRRRGNEYICTKRIPLEPRGDLALRYALGQYRPYKHHPTLCEVCTQPGPWMRVFYIATDKLSYGKRVYSRKRLPGVGCTIPKHCPVSNPYLGRRCTGFEPIEDDGMSCRTCQYK